MATPNLYTFPDYRIADTEERNLALAVKLKNDLCATLAQVAEARRARGEDDTAVLESLDGELAMLAGYRRALENRRKQLKAAEVAR